MLVENAGVFFVPHNQTEEGFETTVGINYFGKISRWAWKSYWRVLKVWGKTNKNPHCEISTPFHITFITHIALQVISCWHICWWTSWRKLLRIAENPGTEKSSWREALCHLTAYIRAREWYKSHKYLRYGLIPCLLFWVLLLWLLHSLQGCSARAVITASLFELLGAVNWGDLEGYKAQESGLQEYSNSKIMTILAAREINKRLKVATKWTTSMREQIEQQ